MKKLVVLIIVCLILLMCVKNEVVIAPPDDSSGSSLRYAQSSDLVINELCTSNSGVIHDESNNDPNWIELFNKGNSSINLSGYGLSDDSTDLYKWKFGGTVIKPKQYLLVFASGKSVTDVRETPKDDTLIIVDESHWSDSEAGGQSTVKPNEYDEIISVDEQNNTVASATITLIDNRPGLGWSSANITLLYERKNLNELYDYSMYNTAEFTMTLEKNKLLCLRFLQGTDMPTWKAPVFALRGTGIKNDVYSIPLIQGNNGLNLKNITGLSIEAPEYNFTSVSFTLKNVRFTHTGYNLHTNFKLSGKDRRLYLCQPDSMVLDTAQISSMPTDMSMGKLKERWVLLKRATPGLENESEFYTGVNQIPVSVKKGGFYDEPVTVALESADSGEIYYTVDGSVPTIASRKYTGPIQIDSTTVVRFVSIKEGCLDSKIMTETFFVNVTTKLAVVSISTEPGALFDPDTGIYEMGPNASHTLPYFGANFWSEKEIPVHIQFFEKNKEEKFSTDAGVSIMGNWSRAQDKKSLGIKFKEKYGQSELDYPLFPEYPGIHKFKKIVLRNNGNNFGRAMIEDPMMQSLMDDRDMDIQKYRPVVVFINGKYFGLHQLMEAANTDYVYSNYGFDEDQIDFYDASGNIKQGTSQHWNMLNDYILSQVKTTIGITAILQDSSYARIKQYMDVNNFIDYMAFEIFINNTDWPSNNCRWWRSSNGKWRWLVYDTDFGFGNNGYIYSARNVSHNTLEFALSDKVEADEWPNGRDWTFLLRALLQNQTFKEDFINRFATLLATNFVPARVNDRIDKMASEIKEEIAIDFPRWGLSVSASSNYVDKLKRFADERPAYAYQFIQQRSEFAITGTYFLTLKTNYGVITVNDMSVKSTSFKGKYFTGIPVRLTVIPPKSRVFKKWADGSIENPRIIDSDKDISLEAICE